MESAPVDDEELRPEVVAPLLEAKAEFQRGGCTPHEEIMRVFGLESD
jgi:hypothetical protein